jgi:hypothetical protein
MEVLLMDIKNNIINKYTNNNTTLEDYDLFYSILKNLEGLKNYKIDKKVKLKDFKKGSAIVEIPSSGYIQLLKFYESQIITEFNSLSKMVKIEKISYFVLDIRESKIEEAEFIQEDVQDPELIEAIKMLEDLKNSMASQKKINPLF